jgi:hypothetical protein
MPKSKTPAKTTRIKAGDIVTFRPAKEIAGRFHNGEPKVLFNFPDEMRPLCGKTVRVKSVSYGRVELTAASYRVAYKGYQYSTAMFRHAKPSEAKGYQVLVDAEEAHRAELLKREAKLSPAAKRLLKLYRGNPGATIRDALEALLGEKFFDLG